MAVKMTGEDWKSFYSDDKVWAKDAWHEEMDFTVNGESWDDDQDFEEVDDTAVVRVEGGFIQNTDGKILEVEKVLRKWRKDQKTQMVLVGVEKKRLGEFKTLMKANNFRVVL